MGKIRNLNKTAKLLIANCITLFGTAAVSLYAFSVAWFYNEKNVSGEDAATTIYSDPSIFSFTYDLYKFETDLNKGVKYSQSECEESRTTNNELLSLSEFDDYIRERNVHKNNLMRFEISFFTPYSTERELNIGISCNDTVIDEEFETTLEDSRYYFDTNGFKYYDGEDSSNLYICNLISNVVSFKAFLYSYEIKGDSSVHYFDQSNFPFVKAEGESYADDDDLIYEKASNYLQTCENNTFVTGSNNNYSKNSDIIISFNSENNNLIPANATNVVMFMEYNYLVTLIDLFESPCELKGNSIDSLSAIGNSIGFKKDLKSIILSSPQLEEGN